MNFIDPDEHDHRGRAPEWDAARRVLAGVAPPDRVEAALLQAFARRHAPQPWYRRWGLDSLVPWASMGAMACMVAVLVAGVWSGDPRGGRPDMAAVVAADGFLSLASPERIRNAVNPQLREANLSRATLVRLGIPIAANAPDELVHAELLVAATGEPLAVRLAVY